MLKIPGQKQMFLHNRDYEDVGLKRIRTKDFINYIVVSASGQGDTNKIGDAINLLPTGGGKIIILEGTYRENVVVDKGNICFEGSGKGTILYGTFEVISQNNVTISDMLIDATGNLTGVWLTDCTYCSIENCTITGATSENITLVECTGINISGNYIHSSAKGIYLLSYSMGTYPGPTTRVIMTGNIVASNSSYGIELETTGTGSITAAIISNNVVVDNGTYEVYVKTANCTNTIISGNYLNGSAGTSIQDAGTATLKDIGGVSLNIL